MKTVKAIEAGSTSGAIKPQYEGKLYGYWGRLTEVRIVRIGTDCVVNLTYEDGSYSPCQNPDTELTIKES